MTVHAADEQRLEKVQLMRDHKVLFLVTTSILERGVTFPEIDVLVLGADDAVFFQVRHWYKFQVEQVVQFRGQRGMLYFGLAHMRPVYD